MSEASARGRGAPYVAAAGVALALWAWAMVRLLPEGCAAGDGDAPPAALVLDLNSAGETELQALPGVGPTLARRIVAEREASGAFRGPDGLLRVRGVTRELIEGIEPFVRFDGSGRPGEVEDVDGNKGNRR
ncbi:MAG: ComEA family DNA-binding protein [Planctomycetota bacterium]